MEDIDRSFLDFCRTLHFPVDVPAPLPVAPSCHLGQKSATTHYFIPNTESIGFVDVTFLFLFREFLLVLILCMCQ